MADQCIVCLEDLDRVPDATRDAGVVDAPTSEPPTTQPGRIDNDQSIALIKPCGHVLHDECLREWSQKANSCPICRHTFNLVEVLDKVGGTVLSEYLVEDKKQIAEFDPNAWIEENTEEEEQVSPCPICGQSDNEDVLLLCDACDAPYHTYCIGLDVVPRGHWFCMECAEDQALAAVIQSEALGRARARQTRTQASERRIRHRLRTDQWMGAWSTFSNRVHDVAGLDLDFSDDDQTLNTWRRHSSQTAAEIREWQQWQQRLRIATRQGAREVFRRAAPILREPTPVEAPEVVQAWGALERAKELDTTNPRNRKRKSRSVTASPVERSEPAKEPERKLKRPRTRRVLDAPGPSSAAASISTPTHQTSGATRQENGMSRTSQDATGEPSFLTQLLKEVETTPLEDDAPRPAFTALSNIDGITSPIIEHSSPAASPSPSSTYHSPRGMSITPPPHLSNRRGSPLPLTSRIEPIFPPADYSPNRSPTETSHIPDHDHSYSPIIEIRQPRPRRQAPVPLARSSESSPVRASMSIEAKEGINKIVKTALAPHWKAAEISKDQYEKINREISRKLYEVVADRSLADEKQKCALEKIATEKVAIAVKSLMAS